MLKVLCFGNPHFKKDMLALEVGRKLKGKIRGVEFIGCGIADEILFEGESKRASIVVLDVVRGIRKVRFVEPEELKSARTVTAHDIDVGFYLKLLARAGKKLRVIGIPEGMGIKKATEDVKSLLLISNKAPRA